MIFRRVGGAAAIAFALILWAACGQVYRPVVIPCTGNSGVPNCPVEPLPTPANFHAVYGLYANAPNGISPTVPNYPGGAMQIDVSGDAIIAETPSNDSKFGNNPTHAAILPNESRLYVASAGSVGGGIDLISNFTTAPQFGSATGFGAVNSIALPNQTATITSISEAGNTVTVTLSASLSSAPVGYTIVISGVVIPLCSPPSCNPNAYDGSFALLSNTGMTITYSLPAAVINLPSLSSSQLTGSSATYPPQPVFLATTQNTAVFVANYNSNSVSEINTASSFVSNTVGVGVNPVSMAEIPNGQKLYVANQTSNNISTLNTVNLGPNNPTGFVANFSGTTPVWMVARGDSQKVYVVSQGDGNLWTIDVASDTVTSSLPVGVGANFVFYDPYLNRLYVTNPATSMLYIFSDTSPTADVPMQLAAISFGPGSVMCPSGCSPESVTALPNGSGFYVASYALAASCPDPVIGTGLPCVIPTLSVFDANSLAPQVTPALTLLSWAPSGTTGGTFSPNQFAVAPAAACAVTTPYSPSTIRFRVFTTAAADSSHVYVSMCDAGAVADINTTDNNSNNSEGGLPANTLVTDLPAAFGNGPILGNGEPANQSPIFMLTGQ
jgi:YVTN family beta-propeller protein